MDTGIEILGIHYSARLRALYAQLAQACNLPINVTPISGHVDNTFQVLPSEILLRLKPGSSEDDVAHELMHGILRYEGFPQMFSLTLSKLAESVRSFTAADFDHLVINARLLQLGYDPQRGFLMEADRYHKGLDLRAHTDPDSQTLLLLTLCHELMKFRFYMGDVQAEPDILAKFPTVRPYWHRLSSAIATLSQPATPSAIWSIAKIYLQIADEIAQDRECSFKPSEYLGFDPVFLAHDALSRTASSVFEITIERTSNKFLVRTFLNDGRVLAGASLFSNRQAASRATVNLALPAEEFAQKLGIHVKQL